MAKRYSLLAIAFCLLFSLSCKKSNHAANNGPNPLAGSWGFEGETTNADIAASAAYGPLNVTVTELINFRTANNEGSFKFTADSMYLDGVSYTIDTTYTTITNTGLTIDTTVTPLVVTPQPLDTSVTYQLIGQDSIYFPKGSPFVLNVDSIQPPIQIKGAHFAISGTTLTITSIIAQSGNETVNGITAPTTGTIKSVITLSQ